MKGEDGCRKFYRSGLKDVIEVDTSYGRGHKAVLRSERRGPGSRP
jgi:hypothetical protein